MGVCGFGGVVGFCFCCCLVLGLFWVGWFGGFGFGIRWFCGGFGGFLVGGDYLFVLCCGFDCSFLFFMFYYQVGVVCVFVDWFVGCLWWLWGGLCFVFGWVCCFLGLLVVVFGWFGWVLNLVFLIWLGLAWFAVLWVLVCCGALWVWLIFSGWLLFCFV